MSETAFPETAKAFARLRLNFRRWLARYFLSWFIAVTPEDDIRTFYATVDLLDAIAEDCTPVAWLAFAAAEIVHLLGKW